MAFKQEDIARLDIASLEPRLEPVSRTEVSTLFGHVILANAQMANALVAEARGDATTRRDFMEKAKEALSKAQLALINFSFVSDQD